MTDSAVYGWAGVCRGVPAEVMVPGSAEDAMRLFREKRHQEKGVREKERRQFLPRGLGRSYGDCALNTAGTLVDCRRLNRVLHFDPDSGVLHCEAGVTLSQIHRRLTADGWLLPVVPGTQFVTVGGAIANDIHGKNHGRHGTFGNHLLAVELLRSNGEVVQCGPDRQRGLFAATVGGLGLTGLILTAKIRLRPVRSLKLDVNSAPFKHPDTLFSLHARQCRDWEYHSVWFDAARGCRSGNYLAANHVADPDRDRLHWPKRKTGHREAMPRWQTDWPGRLLMKAGNLWYRRAVRDGRRTAPAESVLYPLDRWPGWNRLFGRRGFYQHQSVLPEPDSLTALMKLLDVIDRHRQPPTLAVGKWFGPRRSPGLLSFPTAGFSVALDFANRGAATHRLLDALDRVVADHRGRPYPAKDARMSPVRYAEAYPELAQFGQFIDPGFGSDFWRRMERSD